MPKLIQAEDVVTNFYTYEGVVKALNKVGLVVDHGATFGLVGESGCGKSVMVRSMMRIVQEPGQIEGGKVVLFFNGDQQQEAVDLLQQSEAYMEDLRGNHISMIFQEPNAALNPIMSIGDQISESFLFHRKKEMSKKILEDLSADDCRVFLPLKKLQQTLYTIAADNPKSFILIICSKIPILSLWQRRLKREALQRSIDIIRKLSISNPSETVHRYPHNLSGGMKQRIVIAIALACHPMLLIADEATSNLDVTIQAQILELLKDLKKTEIASILLITHDLGIVAETCDRVGVMYAGNLCEVADVEKLFQNPQHPYTKALLESVPKFSQEGRLRSIDGAVPNLVSPPSGCRFHPRCSHAMEICKQTFPEEIEIEENHMVACHLYVK
ncbi:MAG: ABC transporter ATP-binding protein [Desulfobacteraceae bacterium]|nr:ABC transporter ATP-binding protein [Desulfobacteraceae bacterium]